MTPTIPARRYAERLDRAQRELPRQDAAALLVGTGPDLEWLTGYAALPLERLTMLVVPARDGPTLVVPRLEVGAARVAPAVRDGLLRIVPWEETDDPFALVVDALAAAGSRPGVQVGALGGAWGRLGALLVSDRLWATFLLRLQDAIPDAAFGLASPVLGPLRAVKDPEEVALLRTAARAADRVVEAIVRGRLVGRSEADVAREVRERLVDEGHDEAAFWIVASGPNAASPHHDAADRVIAAGDVVVLDIGGRLGGYGSDITRTVWVDGGDPSCGPDETFRTIHSLVLEGQRRAMEAARPGATCASVDETARAVIRDGGFGDRFIHRTGHGIGLEGHEEPYLVAGNETELRPGHAFSVEPGIYLEGRYGVRIEDIVVCGTGAADVLNGAPRELQVVSGLG